MRLLAVIYLLSLLYIGDCANSIYLIEGHQLFAVNSETGSYKYIETYSNPTAIVATSNSLYLINNGALWKIHRETGSFQERITNMEWPSTPVPITYGTVGCSDRIFILAYDKVYSIDPITKYYFSLTGPVWVETPIFMTYIEPVSTAICPSGWIIILENAKLWRVSPHDGTWAHITQPVFTENPSGLVGGKSEYSHVIEAKRIWRVDADGLYTSFPQAVWWDGPIAMAQIPSNTDEEVHLFEASTLHRVDLKTGSYVSYGDAVWNGTPLLAVGTDFTYVEPTTAPSTKPSTSIDFRPSTSMKLTMFSKPNYETDIFGRIISSSSSLVLNVAIITTFLLLNL